MFDTLYFINSLSLKLLLHLYFKQTKVLFSSLTSHFFFDSLFTSFEILPWLLIPFFLINPFYEFWNSFFFIAKSLRIDNFIFKCYWNIYLEHLTSKLTFKKTFVYLFVAVIINVGSLISILKNFFWESLIHFLNYFPFFYTCAFVCSQTTWESETDILFPLLTGVLLHFFLLPFSIWNLARKGWRQNRKFLFNDSYC